jgi:hypothetical protein
MNYFSPVFFRIRPDIRQVKSDIRQDTGFQKRPDYPVHPNTSTVLYNFHFRFVLAKTLQNKLIFFCSNTSIKFIGILLNDYWTLSQLDVEKWLSRTEQRMDLGFSFELKLPVFLHPRSFCFLTMFRRVNNLPVPCTPDFSSAGWVSAKRFFFGLYVNLGNNYYLVRFRYRTCISGS